MSDLPLVRSTLILPPFEHGFTTRLGGISCAPYASLNLGAKWGDDPACVRENRRRLFRAAGIERLYSVTQAHGAEVVQVTGPEEDDATIARSRADALTTSAASVALGVYSADCVALLFCDERTGALAAVHAGWRGTVAGVGPATLLAMMHRSSVRPETVRVAMGPSIGPCCFEVGPEVAAQFSPEFVHAPKEGREKPTLDLRAANRAALERAGLRPENIDSRPPCTHCNSDRFYSFRRDGQQTGQHVAYIVRRT